MHESDAASDRWLSIPNALCAVRLIGAATMIVLAVMGYPWAFFGVMIVSIATDWVDGRIARALNQRTQIGPRLDTLADAAMYLAMLLGLGWLHTETLRSQSVLILAALITYAISVVVAAIRFRRWPSYHTRAAKVCWLLVGVAAIVVFAEGPAWPLGIAMAAVTITNLEATAISLLLTKPRTDVASFYHAMKLQKHDRSTSHRKQSHE